MQSIQTKIKQDFAKYRSRKYEAGQTILFAHEKPPGLFYIVEGKVSMHDFSPKGNEIVLNVYEPGRFFPLGWALNDTPVNFFYKAEAECTVIIVPSPKAIEYITSNPAVCLEVLQGIYRKTDRTFQRMAYLMSSTAARRLLYEILVECRRFGNVRRDGSTFIELREVDMAIRSGLSRETVSREFQKFKEQGMIQFDKSGINVPSVEALEVAIGAIP